MQHTANVVSPADRPFTREHHNPDLQDAGERSRLVNLVVLPEIVWLRATVKGFANFMPDTNSNNIAVVIPFLLMAQLHNLIVSIIIDICLIRHV